MVTVALQKCLEAWEAEHDTLIIIDEPWGYAHQRLSANHQNQDSQVLKIVFTQSPIPEYWQDLLRLKPNALLAGDKTLDDLVEAIKLARPNQTLNKAPQIISNLTPTESKLLWHLAQVKSNKDIAKILDIADHSVANYLTSIFRKLGVDNREEAILYYWGVLDLAKGMRGK